MKMEFKEGEEVFDTFFFPDKKLFVSELAGRQIGVTIGGTNQLVTYDYEGRRAYGNPKVQTLFKKPYTIVFEGIDEVVESETLKLQMEAYRKEEYLETHYEISTRLEFLHQQDNEILDPTFKELGSSGIGACYILARQLTDKFQLKYQNANWGEDGLDWNDTITDFLHENIK
jgi:hypothetical protein